MHAPNANVCTHTRRFSLKCVGSGARLDLMRVGRTLLSWRGLLDPVPFMFVIATVTGMCVCAACACVCVCVRGLCRYRPYKCTFSEVPRFLFSFLGRLHRRPVLCDARGPGACAREAAGTRGAPPPGCHGT